MNKWTKVIRQLMVYLGLFAFLFSCGKEEPPSGGPIDTVPPEVIQTVPSHLSKNAITDKIEIHFSEPIEQRSFDAAITIWPPIGEKKVSWNQKAVTIHILEALQPSTTYYVTIDRHCRDLHANRLKDVYHFVFSTADKFPENSITGKISFDDNLPPGEGITYISLYSVKDSLPVAKSIPQANGSFRFDYLEQGDYLLSAFYDMNDNLEYDADKEFWAEESVHLQVPVLFVPLVLSLQDTIKPTIKRVLPKSRRVLEARFTEPLKEVGGMQILSMEKRTPLEVADSVLTNDVLSILTETPDSVTYMLYLYNLVDLKDNITVVDSAQFTNTLPVDTTSLKITSFSPDDGATLESLLPVFQIEFNKMVPAKNIHFQLFESEKNEEVASVLNKIDGNKFTIIPAAPLENYVPYRLTIFRDTADYEGNRLASQLVINVLPIVFE